ncbi:MAG: 4Fe-4S dicluster domain-containing protein [Clostridia bacterium]|nr:4Fe-4S dicluster domain-containing protein [Clostridia bacterium]
MVEIHAYLCKNCGYCVKFCPKQILEIGTQRNRHGHFYPHLTDAGACISCAICASMCPEGAIELPEKGDA